MSATAVAHDAATATTQEPVIELRDVDVTFRARGLWGKKSVLEA